MTKALTVISGFQIPSYIKQYEAQNEDFGSAGALPKISLKTDKSGFLLTKGGETMLLPAPLPVIILGVSPRGKATSRSFYMRGYTPGSTDPPDCASNGGTFPDSGDAKQSTNCAVCPHSQWGSGPGDGQACSQHKIIFVVPANSVDGDVFQMRIAPTSLKYLGAYGNELTNHGVNKAAVITNIGYREETSKDYPILSFSVAGFLDQINGIKAIERSASTEISNLIHTPSVELPAPPTTAPPVLTRAPAAPPAPPVPPSVPPAPPAAAPLTMSSDYFVSPPHHLLEALDTAGHAWNPTIHAATRTKVANGTWKLKRGVSVEQAAAILKSFPAAPPAAPPTAPHYKNEATAQPTTTPLTAQTSAASALDAALAQWG